MAAQVKQGKVGCVEMSQGGAMEKEGAMNLALLGPGEMGGTGALSHLTQIALEQEPQYRMCPDLCSPQELPQVPSRDSFLFTDKSLEQRLKEIDEECKRKESQRVDLELSLVEVKENLKKAESGPVTLGTAVDTTHLENTAPRVCGAPLAGTAAFCHLGSHTVLACLKMQ